jgi:dTDP-4-dehydrorhamnose reductase
MLRMARERDELRIVDDQFGAPTSSIELADATRSVVSGVLDGRFGPTEDWAGLYHMTCSGSTSWCGFASAIFSHGAGLLHGKVPVVKPISSSEYITPAKRPRNSVLSNEKLYTRFGARLAPWETGLDAVLSRLAESTEAAEL